MVPDIEGIRRAEVTLLAVLTVLLALSFVGPVTAAGSCSNGHVRAQAYIDESSLSQFGPTTQGVLKDFNCEGGAIKAEKVQNGQYRVKIPGITTGSGGSENVVATVTVETSALIGTVHESASDQYFTVFVTNTANGTAASDFSIVVFSK